MEYVKATSEYEESITLRTMIDEAEMELEDRCNECRFNPKCVEDDENESEDE
ncbi:MAG: hypothetical protein GX410_10825 [Elusimicrobia bacterium]|nr:hypothetical protein [Elusimicrobiota bacterium]